MRVKNKIIILIVALLSMLFSFFVQAEVSLDIPKINNPPPTISVPPDFNVKAYMLIDAYSGTVIAEKNADTRLEPASLTKLMTLYLTANALKSGQVHLTDPVTISANAWRMGGSKMFIKQNSSVPLGQLIDGVVIASGNDAAVAIAEFLGGSEQNFVNSMNQTAKKLNLTNTNFVDSNGLPAENHYSCARDLANLARVWILDLPDYYPWFKQKWITFNRIKQPNRNRLLWRDPSVDGMKTGHTDNAGYCLIASALRNNMRLVAVIMGAPSDGTRFDYAERLLDYGYRYFESHKLYAEGATLTRQRVWFGKEKMLSLGLKRDLYATTQMGHYKNLTANLSVNKDLKAPINKGDTLGTVNVFAGGKLISSEPLIALNDVPKAGLFGSFFDHIAWFFHRFL